ncbi:hypothetical protein ANO11243_035090 [Dothideomycetidae sp. 11243]|nr:hypothetical protein ANO11243_035090 [fungal sp. No.11243]
MASWENAPVLGFRLVNHIPDMEAPRIAQKDSGNHVTTWLVIGHESTVQFNMRTFDEDIKGFFLVDPKRYLISRTELTHLDLNLVPGQGLTPGIMKSMIEASQMDMYWFDSQGYGCRYWQLCLVDQMQAQGFLAAGSTIKALDFLQLRFSRAQNPEPIDIYHGTFGKSSVQTVFFDRWTMLVAQVAALIAPQQQMVDTIQDRCDTLTRELEGLNRGNPRYQLLSNQKTNLSRQLDLAREQLHTRVLQHESMVRSTDEANVLIRDRHDWFED